jgi:hypothetical protein
MRHVHHTLAVPFILNGNFSAWLDSVVFSTLAVAELQDQLNDPNAMERCLTRMAALKNQKKGGRYP